jgi:predicted glycosyltransferase
VRILCHAQSLSGVGHSVRMRAIASGLAAAHEVHLADGGRPVPHAPAPFAPTPVPLPRLARVDGGVRGERGAPAPAALFAARARALADAALRLRPDVVLVDHHPFGKWELSQEIGALADAARRARPGARVVCSLRDVVRHGRFEVASRAAWEAGVLARLAAHFDAVWVHGDPAFTRLDEHFGRAAELPVPVRYTGFVSPPPPPAARPPGAPRHAVLSCGGGARSLPFLRAAIAAFRRLHARGALGALRLEVFAGAFATAQDEAALRAAAEGGPVALHRFTPEFPGRLAASALSISRAGYNTSALLLRTGVPAVVVPDPVMSDQVPRARRLAARGLVALVEGEPPGEDALAGAIEAALARPAPRHGFDLEGVAGTGVELERLAGVARACR